MWLLSWLPDSFLIYAVNCILFVGAVSFFISFFLLHRILNKFPALAPYNLPIQIISTILLVAGIYFKGGYDTEASWRAKVAEAEAKVAKAEAESKQANEALDKKSKEKVKIVKEKGLVIKQYIDRVVSQDKEVIKFVENCPIPKKIIDVHNAAATNTPIEEKK